MLHALEAENDWLREQAEVATALAERATTDAVVATKLYEAASKRADVAERQAEALAGALRNQGLLQNASPPGMPTEDEPCPCSPGDECLCDPDCECRAKWQHYWYEDVGTMNVGDEYPPPGTTPPGMPNHFASEEPQGRPGRS